MESYVRIGGRYLNNLTYAHMSIGGGGEGVKKCQNHAYVINEWPVNTHGGLSQSLLCAHIHLFSFD